MLLYIVLISTRSRVSVDESLQINTILIEGVIELLSHRDDRASRVVSAFVVGDCDDKAKAQGKSPKPSPSATLTPKLTHPSNRPLNAPRRSDHNRYIFVSENVSWKNGNY